MPIDVGLEAGSKKTFAWVIDWPGWCRSGKTEHEALERLVAYRRRYAIPAEVAGLKLPTMDASDVRVAERSPGGAGTDFGVPSTIGDSDRRSSTAAEAERLAAIVEAAWTVLDRVVASAPAELRKGPRGGGRDRDKAFEHTVLSDVAYAHELGVKRPTIEAPDRPAIEELRAAMLDVLSQASDGAPVAGRRWTARYGARRIAWHALDHAWEIEDRSEPVT